MTLALFFLDSALAAGELSGNFLPGETTLFDRAQSFVGIFLLVAIAWVLSENRKAINWRPVVWGVGLQLLFGAVVLSPALSYFFFTVVNTGVNQLLFFSGEGANFVFQSVEPHSITVGSVPELQPATASIPIRAAAAPLRRQTLIDSSVGLR